MELEVAETLTGSDIAAVELEPGQRQPLALSVASSDERSQRSPLKGSRPHAVAWRSRRDPAEVRFWRHEAFNRGHVAPCPSRSERRGNRARLLRGAGAGRCVPGRGWLDGQGHKRDQDRHELTTHREHSMGSE